MGPSFVLHFITFGTRCFGIITNMEKIATDTCLFEKFRKNGFVYVDKTDLLWRFAAMKDGSQFDEPFFVAL